MSNTPLVSVLMPVYNAGSYFQPALLSIINQTYTNWELIIADDGCTDGCLEILTAINDPRIIVIRDSMNLGISKRLNQMIGMARGQYFARMDSDDIAHTDRLREQLCLLLENPQLDLIASRANIINNNNVVVGELPFKLTHNEICAKPWFGFYMAHPTWMGKASWFRQFKYSETTSYCEDQELLLRSYNTSNFATLNKVLLDYRVYPNTPLSKLIKTRVSLFKHQIKYFYNNQNYLNLIYSTLTFVVKVFKSIFSKFV